jgi:hypothetical protein
LQEKPIKFSHHALDNMTDQGATVEEVESAIRTGEYSPAKKGRLSFRAPHKNLWVRNGLLGLVSYLLSKGY